MVLNLKYDTPIKTDTTLMKDPLKSIYTRINKSDIKIFDENFFDDGIELRFKEDDLEVIIDILDNKHGCYSSRSKRPPKSIKNLPDYKSRRLKVEVIKHKKLYEKLSGVMKDLSDKTGKPLVVLWNKLYSDFKEQEGIDLKHLANEDDIKPIYIIDNKNYYGKLFNILGL